MHVTVLTPCYNSLPYLRRCCASVRDQTGIEVEHLVLDGASTDGTPEWLATQDVSFVSEPDGGMYAALNKGLDRAPGEVVGHLNADEQYLPGALAAVARVFAEHPEVDLVFGDALLVNPDGQLLAFRKAYPLRWPYLAAGQLYALTCTLFYRRRILAAGHRFDPRYRMMGDVEFIVRLLRAGYRPLHLKHYLAAFTMTGENLSTHPRANAELQMLRATLPTWARVARPGLEALRLAEKWWSGAYRERAPLRYELYPEAADRRHLHESRNLSHRWTWA